MGHDDHYIYLNRLENMKNIDRQLSKILPLKDRIEIYFSEFKNYFTNLKQKYFSKNKTIENSVN